MPIEKPKDAAAKPNEIARAPRPPFATGMRAIDPPTIGHIDYVDHEGFGNAISDNGVTSSLDTPVVKEKKIPPAF